jgi:hypothetical protein
MSIFEFNFAFRKVEVRINGINLQVAELNCWEGRISILMVTEELEDRLTHIFLTLGIDGRDNSRMS